MTNLFVHGSECTRGVICSYNGHFMMKMNSDMRVLHALTL